MEIFVIPVRTNIHPGGHHSISLNALTMAAPYELRMPSPGPDNHLFKTGRVIVEEKYLARTINPTLN